MTLSPIFVSALDSDVVPVRCRPMPNTLSVEDEGDEPNADTGRGSTPRLAAAAASSSDGLAGTKRP